MKWLAPTDVLGARPKPPAGDGSKPPTLPAPRRPPGSRSRLTRIALGAGAMWVAVATFQLLLLGRDVRAAARAADAVSGLRRASALTAVELGHELDRAHRAMDQVARRAKRPILAPLRVVPVLGRQLTSLQQVAEAGSQVAEVGVRTTGAVRAQLAKGPETPAGRVERLRRLATLASGADRALAQVDLRSPKATVRPLSFRWRDLTNHVIETRTALQRAALVLDGMADLLTGPRRYLLLAANNAEMRAGSGMLLSAGVIETAQGSLQLGPMLPTGNLTLPGTGVQLPAELAERWGGFQPGREWRNLATTPRFDVTAPLAADMWQALTGERVDGVLAVDVPLLASLLAVTGPVNVGERLLTSDNVVEYLLHGQYDGLDYGESEQDGRRDELGRIAAATVQALQERSYDLQTLTRHLGRALQSRHLLAWSGHPRDHRTWVAAGRPGALPDDGLAVNVLNRGGNKLDWFTDVGADLDVRVSDASTDVTLTVRVRNRVPVGEPPYVAGPHPESGAREGDYVGIVAVNLPGRATEVTAHGGRRLVSFGRDGPTTVVGTSIVVPRGQEEQVVVRFRLDSRRGSLLVVPSARTPPVRWHAGARSWTDDEPRRLTWPQGHGMVQ